MPITSRLKLPWPAGTARALVPDDIRKLAEALDGVAPIRVGLTGARPPAGTAGALYRATDTGVTWIDDGTDWRQLSGPHGATHAWNGPDPAPLPPAVMVATDVGPYAQPYVERPVPWSSLVTGPPGSWVPGAPNVVNLPRGGLWQFVVSMRYRSFDPWSSIRLVSGATPLASLAVFPWVSDKGGQEFIPRTYVMGAYFAAGSTLAASLILSPNDAGIDVASASLTATLVGA